MNILIIGCGYVGSTLARQLIADGHHVTGVVRSQESAETLASLSLPCRVADVSTPNGAKAATEGDFDTIVLSISSRGGDYQRTYVDSMRHILVAARASPPSHILYTSSTSVYGQDSGEWVTESSPAEPRHEKGSLLVQTENLLRESSIPSTILRLTGIYGPGRHMILDKLREGVESLPGKGGVWVNQIHRDDAAGAIHFLLGKPPAEGNRIVHVTDDQPVLRKDFVAWLCQKLGRTPPNFDPSEKVASHRGRDVQPNRRISNETLKKLGWKPKYPSFQDGYAKIVSAVEGDTRSHLINRKKKRRSRKGPMARRDEGA